MSRTTVHTDPKIKARRAAALRTLDEAWAYYSAEPPGPARDADYVTYPVTA